MTEHDAFIIPIGHSDLQPLLRTGLKKQTLSQAQDSRARSSLYFCAVPSASPKSPAIGVKASRTDTATDHKSFLRGGKPFVGANRPTRRVGIMCLLRHSTFNDVFFAMF